VGYDENVFINCPFDGDYQPLFRALVFAVQFCGFVPRSALELDDGSEVRIGKIIRIIAESRYGVHDLSRTELDVASQLPRFNMPLELGLFLGAKYYGVGLHQAKAAIIFDREQYRYQAFCSDIAGQDVRAHNGGDAELIRAVRNELATWRPERFMPGGGAIYSQYRRFTRALPRMAAKTRLREHELNFNDLTRIIDEWLIAEPG
jgi:hypothetical protein